MEEVKTTEAVVETVEKEDLENDRTNLILGVLGAFAFNVWVTVSMGTDAGAAWLSCYVLEYSLSVDNLFVFIVIFNYFDLASDLQLKVLNFGIAGAVVFRFLFVFLGAELLQQANFLILFFAAILIYASVQGFLKDDDDDDEEDMENNWILQNIKKVIEVSPKLDGDKFFTQIDGRTVATPLFLCCLVIELSDIVFATDSVPAVLGTTQDPFIAYSSNIFAVFGLRSLFFLLREAMVEFVYLEPAVNLVLGFIGVKIVVDYFGVIEIPTLGSLAIVLSILFGGVILSIREADKPEEEEGK